MEIRMNIFKGLWNLIKGTHKVVHNIRVDLNLFLTEHVLDKLDGSEKIDEVERKLIKGLISFLNNKEIDTTKDNAAVVVKGMELATQHEDDIADAFVEVLNKANRVLAKRARNAKKIQ